MHVSNQLQLKGPKKVRKTKGKKLCKFQHGNSQNLQLTHEEDTSKFFSVLDWKYVIVDPETEISDQESFASFEIHDQKELFEYLNQLNLIENLQDNFWIEKKVKNFPFCLQV
jgi:hypothetical protein